MVAVRVKYTVTTEYIEQNKANIRKVMDFLKANPIEGMLYSSFNIEGDEQTFVHINICKDGETLSKLNDVEAFQNFRQSLKASSPISPPQQTKLIPVGAGFEL